MHSRLNIINFAKPRYQIVNTYPPASQLHNSINHRPHKPQKEETHLILQGSSTSKSE